MKVYDTESGNSTTAMAFVNVPSWSPEQVAEWLRGLDDVILPYVHFFLNHEVNGKQLLYFGADNLEALGINKLGHQEIILEALELLCNLHFGLERENLQALALQVSCTSNTLRNEVMDYYSDSSGSPRLRSGHCVSILSGVCYVIRATKTMLSWLNRFPFELTDEYIILHNNIMKLSMELLAASQSDTCSPTNLEKILDISMKLAEICDNLIRNAKDSLVIQPATLEFANIRKKPAEELGIHIHSSYDGIHTISAVNNPSPAHVSGKVEEGDEVVQVNYQTVIAWQHKKLVSLMRENHKEIYLTLKKRPYHSSTYGKPIRRKQKPKPLQSTFPKAHKRRSGGVSGADKLTTRSPLLAAIPPSQDKLPGRDVDTDNEVFRSGSESPQLDRDEKKRRATVTGASPVIDRTNHVVTNEKTPGVEMIGSYQITSETKVQRPSPVLRRKDLSPVMKKKKEKGHEAKTHSRERKISRVQQPALFDAKSDPVLMKITKRSSTSKDYRDDASDDNDSTSGQSRTESDQEGSYMINVVGGVPQKIPMAGVDPSYNSPSVVRMRKQKPVKKTDRRVSCKDLGQGMCQGWLWKKKIAHLKLTGSKWSKRWFVLKGPVLYYYKDPDDTKAEGLIAVPGFQVSPAPEIKGKRFAFKLAHSGTTFYFASDSQEDRSKWMNKLGLAAIGFDASSTSAGTIGGFHNPGASVKLKVPQLQPGYYSESEEESDRDTDKDSLSYQHRHTTDSDSSSISEDFHSRHNCDSPAKVKITVTDSEGSEEPVRLRRQGDELKRLTDQFKRQNLSIIDGENMNSRRRTVLAKTTRSSDEVEKMMKLQSLQRTLKDKERDLEAVNEFLSSDITSQDLHTFENEYPHLCTSLNLKESDV
ncbi:connector enhancer of kinase suppressor of ras 2-like isoform X2 [Tubulanus polymorphus]|uniref:connector enhancer of kinase suppressor of ras 2-like isoform X2 n=1 Tax=Tubulanus polymorphus TaxID=672921 RepID=UPI003DA5A3BF